MGTPPQGAGPYRPPQKQVSDTFHGNEADFKSWNLLPPTALYIQRDDRLRLRYWQQQGNSSVRISGRWMDLCGEVHPFQFTVPVNANANVVIDNYYDLGEGFLLDVQCDVSGSTAAQGTLFAQASISRGGSAAPYSVGVLSQGYIDGAFGISWPIGNLKNPLDGPGYFTNVAVGNPAAGADWSVIPGTSLVTKLHGAVFVLTTAVAVATRTVRLQIKAGASVVYESVAASTQVASLAYSYFATSGPYATTSPTDVAIGFSPGLVVPPGYSIGTATLNLQAADQYSAIYLLAEQIII